MTAGQTYYYVVTAVDSGGKRVLKPGAGADTDPVERVRAHPETRTASQSRSDWP